MDGSLIRLYTQPEVDEIAKWAYFAGILDSEGWIGSKLQLHLRRPSPGPRVKVESTTPAMQLFCEAMSGSAQSSSIGYIEETSTRKSKTEWRIGRAKTIWYTLTNVLPYLQIKTAQAELVLKLAESIIECRRSNGRLPDDVHGYRMELHEQLKALNRVGLRPNEVNENHA